MSVVAALKDGSFFMSAGPSLRVFPPSLSTACGILLTSVACLTDGDDGDGGDDGIGVGKGLGEHGDAVVPSAIAEVAEVAEKDGLALAAPRVAEGSAPPIMVNVFPEPVCPYAKRQVLNPVKHFSTTSRPISVSSNCSTAI